MELTTYTSKPLKFSRNTTHDSLEMEAELQFTNSTDVSIDQTERVWVGMTYKNQDAGNMLLGPFKAESGKLTDPIQARLVINADRASTILSDWAGGKQIALDWSGNLSRPETLPGGRHNRLEAFESNMKFPMLKGNFIKQGRLKRTTMGVFSIEAEITVKNIYGVDLKKIAIRDGKITKYLGTEVLAYMKVESEKPLSPNEERVLTAQISGFSLRGRAHATRHALGSTQITLEASMVLQFGAYETSMAYKQTDIPFDFRLFGGIPFLG